MSLLHCSVICSPVIGSDFIIPVVILLSHTIIDLLKRSIKRDSIALFLADQIAHLLVILVLSFYMQNKLTTGYWLVYFGLRFGVYLFKGISVNQLHVILITKFSSIIISYIIKPFQAKIIGLENNDGEGIKTGRLIGYLERLIILILFLSNLPAVVGFLITAKSILRYGEIKNEKDKIMVEYVLIGTLLSFTTWNKYSIYYN